eukprot:CRZ04663.1 hypothetical protein [Spongospora subterranea]
MFGRDIQLGRQLSWRELFMSVPHVRFDGVYCLQVSYWRKGSSLSNYALFRLSYYRYLRFMPDQTVLYALVNDPPQTLIPRLFNVQSSSSDSQGEVSDPGIYRGRYKVNKKKVSIIVEMRHMVAGIRVRIDSTSHGKFNRLEFVSLSSISDDAGGSSSFRVPDQPFCFHYVNW